MPTAAKLAPNTAIDIDSIKLDIKEEDDLSNYSGKE